MVTIKQASKPISLLNVYNFYSLLFFFLTTLCCKVFFLYHFLPILTQKEFVHTNTTNELIDILQTYQPEPISTISQLTSDDDKGKKDDDKGKNDGDKRKKGCL